MRNPGPRPRILRSVDLAEHREAAEHRYDRYLREIDTLLAEAARARAMGRWAAAATSLQASVATMTAAQGCAREMNLLYQLSGE